MIVNSPHRLDVNFQHSYDMSKEEAEYFSEAWSHFHKIMTEINGQFIRNTLFLNENFFELWNENTPQKMLELCIEEAVYSLTLNTPEDQSERKNMIYQYKCTNPECSMKDEEVDRSMPISEAGTPQYCEECNEQLQKIFSSPGVRTGDGYKY